MVEATIIAETAEVVYAFRIAAMNTQLNRGFPGKKKLITTWHNLQHSRVDCTWWTRICTFCLDKAARTESTKVTYELLPGYFLYYCRRLRTLNNQRSKNASSTSDDAHFIAAWMILGFSGRKAVRMRANTRIWPSIDQMLVDDYFWPM